MSIDDLAGMMARALVFEVRRLGGDAPDEIAVEWADKLRAGRTLRVMGHGCDECDSWTDTWLEDRVAHHSVAHDDWCPEWRERNHSLRKQRKAARR